jgi:hypothetical protein
MSRLKINFKLENNSLITKESTGDKMITNKLHQLSQNYFRY